MPRLCLRRADHSACNRESISKTSIVMLQGVMETEDVDRNLFILDVTKTAFLEEDFTLSRAGGSLATAAVRRPLSRNEGERVSLAPSATIEGKNGTSR